MTSMTITMSILIFLSLPALAAEKNSPVWAKIDSINKTLGPKGKMPPAFRIFQEQFELAVQISGDPGLDKQFQDVKSRALDTDDFREANKLKKRAAPAFILEFDGEGNARLLDFDYFQSRTLEGSPAREFFATYKRYFQHFYSDDETSAPKPSGDSDKCFLPIDPSRSKKWADDSLRAKKKPATADEIKEGWKTLEAKLPEGFLKSKAADFLSCINVTKESKPAKNRQ